MTQQPTDQARAFNPNNHLIQLKSREGSKDYLPVQWRLVWFREQCPNGTIDTEEILVDLDREVEEEAFVWNSEKRRSEKVTKQANGYARFKAIITDGKGGRATGTKSENAASFPDYIEKAETGAIGRALAALGYGTQFSPEFDEAHRIVDSPVERQERQQESLASSEIDNLKTEWAEVYKIADNEIEERWPKFIVYVLKSAVADPDLKPVQAAQVRGMIEQQRRKVAQKAS